MKKGKNRVFVVVLELSPCSLRERGGGALLFAHALERRRGARVRGWERERKRERTPSSFFSFSKKCFFFPTTPLSSCSTHSLKARFSLSSSRERSFLGRLSLNRRHKSVLSRLSLLVGIQSMARGRSAGEGRAAASGGNGGGDGGESNSVGARLASPGAASGSSSQGA